MRVAFRCIELILNSKITPSLPTFKVPFQKLCHHYQADRKTLPSPQPPKPLTIGPPDFQWQSNDKPDIQVFRYLDVVRRERETCDNN